MPLVALVGSGSPALVVAAVHVGRSSIVVDDGDDDIAVMFVVGSSVVPSAGACAPAPPG